MHAVYGHSLVSVASNSNIRYPFRNATRLAPAVAEFSGVYSCLAKDGFFSATRTRIGLPYRRRIVSFLRVKAWVDRRGAGDCDLYDRLVKVKESGNNLELSCAQPHCRHRHIVQPGHSRPAPDPLVLNLNVELQSSLARMSLSE